MTDRERLDWLDKYSMEGLEDVRGHINNCERASCAKDVRCAIDHIALIQGTTLNTDPVRWPVDPV